MKNFAKLLRKHQYRILFFDKVRPCRSATWLKIRLWRKYFLVNCAKFVRAPFFVEHNGTAAFDCGIINSSEGEFASESVNYDTEMKAHQFEV